MKNLLTIVNQVKSELTIENLYILAEAEGLRKAVEIYAMASLFDKLKDLEMQSYKKGSFSYSLYKLHKNCFLETAIENFNKEYKNVRRSL